MPNTHTPPRLAVDPAAWAAYFAPQHPVTICLDFDPMPEDAFFCAGCGWNRPVHRLPGARPAVAAWIAEHPEAVAAWLEKTGGES
jgi:hypothetical protein